jgi:hypothetical protein
MPNSISDGRFPCRAFDLSLAVHLYPQGSRDGSVGPDPSLCLLRALPTWNSLPRDSSIAHGLVRFRVPALLSWFGQSGCFANTAQEGHTESSVVSTRRPEPQWTASWNVHLDIEEKRRRRLDPRLENGGLVAQRPQCKGWRLHQKTESPGALVLPHRFLHGRARANKSLVPSSTLSMLRLATTCEQAYCGVNSDFKKRKGNVSLHDRLGPRAIGHLFPRLKTLGSS